MKNTKLILIALSLIVILLFILIVGPTSQSKLLENTEAVSVESESPNSLTELSEGQASKISQVQNNEAKESTQETQTKGAEENQKPIQLKFNLKYDKYLVEAPYTYTINGEARHFQFEEMLKHIQVADQASSQHQLTYIDNYKNRNGYAPYYKGGSVDNSGTSRSASAPAYPNLNDLKEFIYLQDGTLVSVLEEDGDYTLVSPVGTNLEYSVPRQYVRTDDCLTGLKKVIVVDRTNQNIATFEKEREYTSGGNKQSDDMLLQAEGNGIKAGWNDVWYITSYSMATTGKVGDYHQPTPLGYYYAIERRERFYYLKDGTNTIDGYAPYAVRFTAGAYTHGISTAYKYSSTGQRIDPGINEFSSTIGTIPLSHKCVRNYTSHAKFIYNWYEHGKTIVIVIE